MRPFHPAIAFVALSTMMACSTVSGSASATQGAGRAEQPAPAPASPTPNGTAVAPGGGSAFERSTTAGVYTAAQARRGEGTYATQCTGCHTVAAHTGAKFWEQWGGRPLSELFAYLVESMPKSDPGTLTPAEYGAIVAFMLRQNGMPPGTQELPADTVSLRKIRVDSATGRIDTTERG